jgi:hypothetical protein
MNRSHKLVPTAASYVPAPAADQTPRKFLGTIVGKKGSFKSVILRDSIFLESYLATIYYLPGTSGWSYTFFSHPDGPPAVLWNLQAVTSDPSFGVRMNHFGFNITGSSNLVIVVEACTNLAYPTWIPVQTNTLAGGSSYFSDSQWTNYPACFYRLSSP